MWPTRNTAASSTLRFFHSRIMKMAIRANVNEHNGVSLCRIARFVYRHRHTWMAGGNEINIGNELGHTIAPFPVAVNE